MLLLWKSLAATSGDAAGTIEPTLSMTGVPTEGTTALEELTSALAAGTVTEDDEEAEGVKWESLSELWAEWRSGSCGPAAVLLLLLLPLAVLV